MSIEIRVDATPIREALLRAPAAAIDAADRALETGAVALHREAVRLAPKAEGALARGIQFGRFEKTADRVIWQVVARAAHSVYVERGTKPHRARPGVPNRRNAGGRRRAPTQFQINIAQWLARRGITPRPVPGRTKPEAPERGQLRLAWLISRAIARRGTRQQPYLIAATQGASGARIAMAVNQSLLRSLSTAGLG